jgi:tRNA A-37 threonylcarbamoyl transferase component Bud32
MATGSKSTLFRLGASAGARLTEGLLSSNGKVAGVGLFTALATLGFTIWFGVELRYQSEVGAPLARSAAEMNAAINQSLAALRGWAAYGDPAMAEERTRIWEEQIHPTQARLEELSARSKEADDALRVAELGESLRDLKVVQWAIQDVARTPGNEPAAVEYAKRLEPLRRSVLRSIADVIEQVGAQGGARGEVRFLTELARFRAAFTEGDLALHELLSDYSDVKEHEVRERLTRSQALAANIALEAPRETSGDLLRLLEFTLEEFSAYELQVPAVVALRRSAAWNVAQLLYAQEAQPLSLRSRQLANELAEAQAQASVVNAETLARASYAVIAMALLMGLLSAGSLAVSFRLQKQVENVIAKAKKLGQYEIDHPLGKGGMGQVYLAHHAMLRRPTAIKLLRAENARNLRAQARFQREVQLSCQLTHPNTIEIFDYGRTPEGVFYYAMEYLDGFTLQTLVTLAGPVPPARVASILTQACGSLHEAHALGLLHRDIKPSNIMLTIRGGVYDTVKILDFGLVMELAGGVDDESDVIAGTPMYLAPEAILSSDAATLQADLYALGAVGYYLLTGTTLFDNGSVTEILSRHLNEHPEFPSRRLGRELPQDLEYVIMACLAKDPAERPESAARLAEMLAACDCGSWSQHDARLWWQEFGEAARNTISSDETRDTLARSDLQVVVGGTLS